MRPRAQEDEAFVEDTFLDEAVHGGLDDVGAYFLHEDVVGKGNGRHAAHAAGVQTLVTLTDAFVVLGYGEHLVVLAVGQHEDGALDAAEKLLDDHRGAGVAEHAAQHLLQFALGFVQRGQDELQRGQDEHALAGAEAVGLQHVGSFEGFEEGEAFFQIGGGDALVAGGGDAVALHEAFGKLLAAFERGSGFRPTTIISTPFFRTKSLMAGKSVALMSTFSPAACVPALPGAM